MLSENIQMFLILIRNILWFGIIGYGFWFSVGIIMEAKTQEKIVPAMMKIEKRIKNLGGEKRKNV